MAAGAHVFLDKPIESLALFQQSILDHLPAASRPPGPRPVPADLMRPDRIALSEDLNQVARALDRGLAPDEAAYYAAFLAGLARAAGDDAIAVLSGQLAALAKDGARVAAKALTPLRDDLRTLIGQPGVI